MPLATFKLDNKAADATWATVLVMQLYNALVLMDYIQEYSIEYYTVGFSGSSYFGRNQRNHAGYYCLPN
jgi:hypothetical protein